MQRRYIGRDLKQRPPLTYWLPPEKKRDTLISISKETALPDDAYLFNELSDPLIKIDLPVGRITNVTGTLCVKKIIRFFLLVDITEPVTSSGMFSSVRMSGLRYAAGEPCLGRLCCDAGG